MKFENLVLPSNQKFGFFFTAIFLIISIYFGYLQAVYPCLIFAAISMIFFVTAIVSPKSLRYLNILWIYIGYLIGSIVSPLVLGAIFYFIFTPISIFLRITGRDELDIKNIYENTSWKYKDSSFDDFEKFKRQF